MLTAWGLCWLCRMPLAQPRRGVCSRCSAALLLPRLLCPQCGLPAGRTDLPCGRCLQKPPPWQRLIAVSDYAPPLRPLLHRFKFSRQPELAPALARLLLLAWLQTRRSAGLARPDVILSVPLFPRRHWRRGFNQSDLLCRPLAHWLGCRYAENAIERVRPTQIQHRLTAARRRRNLKNAFRLEFSPRGRHMVVVDDVVTTGSTVAEISRLLLGAGAATVQIWCLCRTL
ncbi:ComF family protein [Enterobacter sp. BIGb0383]|uniref:DNA utilization protein GntX n=1 Tax=unclassified Enterobacter TaxID=2608935 RepID=UPI000F4735F5|nr:MULTISPECIES: DNA utilization protein GntX [unclassified Enterobacter]ROP56415.1 ComF family protein [Enterobacter sp. BIGb0383]ROS04481.1 ComF family protein [Enterobacter sp. BIGb0359]